jgi:hypothetical protein
MSALQDVVVGKPEAAGEKGAFIPGQAINRALGVVAGDETVLQQIFLDRPQGSLNARVLPTLT